MKYIIDRLEEEMAVCENESREMIPIPLKAVSYTHLLTELSQLPAPRVLPFPPREGSFRPGHPHPAYPIPACPLPAVRVSPKMRSLKNMVRAVTAREDLMDAEEAVSYTHLANSR